MQAHESARGQVCTVVDCDLVAVESVLGEVRRIVLVVRE